MNSSNKNLNCNFIFYFDDERFTQSRKRTLGQLFFKRKWLSKYMMLEYKYLTTTTKVSNEIKLNYCSFDRTIMIIWNHLGLS